MPLNLVSIRAYVGVTSFQRGNQYFVSGNVISCHIEDDIIYGKVRGSRNHPYDVEIMIEDGEIIDSERSCPVGYECKHVAALGLKALVQLSKNPPAAAVDASKPKPKQHKKSEWQTILSQIIERSEQHKALKVFSLQILFSLEGDSRNYFSEKYLEKLAEPVWNVVMRPRIYDAETGKYSISEIKWPDTSCNGLIYWDKLTGRIPDEQFLFLQLLSEGRNSRYGRGWEKVKDERAKYVWKILQEHEEYGVSLLGGKKVNLPVTFDERVYEVILMIDEAGKGLRLKKTIFCEGKIVEAKPLALVGEPAAFAIVEEDGRYVIHPVESRLPDNAILQKSIFIPKDEINILQSEFLPKLAKDIGVTAKTNAVILPETVAPFPYLAVNKTANGFIKINPGVTYQEKVYLLNAILDYINIDSRTVLLNKENVDEIRRIFKKYIPGQDAAGTALAGIVAARFIGGDYSETAGKLAEFNHCYERRFAKL